MTNESTTTATTPEENDALAADFLAKNRKRRKARKWIGLGSIPVLLVAALVVTKLLSMYAAAHMSIASYITGDGSGASRAAQWQYPLNYIEPYKAPFNNGVGLALNAQYKQAKAEFEKALTMTTGLEECAVRVNLSITIERQGDEMNKAGDAYAAKKLYDEALLKLLQGPKGCDDKDDSSKDSSDPSRDMQQQRQDTQQRLEEKQQEQQQKQDDQQKQQEQGGQQGEQKPDPGNGDQQQPPQGGPSQQQLDQLQQRLERGEQDRDDSKRDEDGQGGQSGTDKPW